MLHFKNFSCRYELYRAYRTQAKNQIRELQDHLMCSNHWMCPCNNCDHIRRVKQYFCQEETMWAWICTLDEESI